MKLSKLLDVSGIPCDVYENTTRSTVLGKKELFLENYSKLLSCTEHQIVIQMHRGRMEIEGEHLRIDSYTAKCMCIQGTISVVRYV